MIVAQSGGKPRLAAPCRRGDHGCGRALPVVPLPRLIWTKGHVIAWAFGCPIVLLRPDGPGRPLTGEAESAAEEGQHAERQSHAREGVPPGDAERREREQAREVQVELTGPAHPRDVAEEDRKQPDDIPQALRQACAAAAWSRATANLLEIGQRCAVLRPADGGLDLDQVVETDHANAQLVLREQAGSADEIAIAAPVVQPPEDTERAGCGIQPRINKGTC